CLFSRLRAWIYVIFILLILGFFTKGISFFSREVLTLWAITAYIMQAINYVIFTILTLKLRKKYNKKCPAMIIGTCHTAQKLATSVNENIWLGHKVVGYVNDAKSDQICDIPCLGSLGEVEGIIEQHNIKRIYIVLPSHKQELLESLYLKLMLKDVDLYWVPDISSLNLINHHVKEISGMPVLALSEKPLAGMKLSIKTLFDIVLSTIALILIGPLMLIVALVIKLTSKGPVLFCQERHGWNNKVFKIYKFRSMKVHQEANGQVTQAFKNDDRVTAVGRFIRRTSIDELPQLFNVIKGDMSLVGPRPHALSHNDYFQLQINNYLARHKIKPGITGLAQITGFRGETNTLDKMNGRVQQDMTYINNWSFSLDFEILFKTFLSLSSDITY
ncbi:MAG: undecaprenyl-phosphate glucose phosphotransferase, partial [Thiotrichaceae bacterium]|nr:undecaprenyl-phosphate glucose phosphotransferase [Thiotrichaceae bacterium]